MQEFITAKQAEIEELCRTHHVRRFSVFGSAVRDDFDPETSDVDVRVEFEPDFLEGYVRNFHSFMILLLRCLDAKWTSSVQKRSEIATFARKSTIRR